MYTWPALLTSPSETPRERYGRRRRWGAAPHKMPLTDRQRLVAPRRRRPAPAGTNKHTLAEPNWRWARKIFQMAPSPPSLASLSYANTDNKYFWSDHNKIHIFAPKDRFISLQIWRWPISRCISICPCLTQMFLLDSGLRINAIPDSQNLNIYSFFARAPLWQQTLASDKILAKLEFCLFASIQVNLKATKCCATLSLDLWKLLHTYSSS